MSGATGSQYPLFPRFPNMLPMQPMFGKRENARLKLPQTQDTVQFGARNNTQSQVLDQFRGALFRVLDDAANFSATEATDIRTMTRRYGISSLSSTTRKITVTLAEKADAYKKESVRRAVAEMNGTFHGKDVTVIERPCPHLELGGHQSWSGLK